MNKTRYGILVIGIVIMLSLVLWPAIISRYILPGRSISIGFWTQGFWNSTTQTVNPSAMETLETEIGKNVAIASYYDGWASLSQVNTVTNLNTIIGHGWRPMISANPYFFSGCSSDGMTLYKSIASGNCDAFLRQVGDNLKHVSKPFYLRFAWEMNVNANSWSIQKTGDTPEDYIAAWRRLHDIVESEGATNVLWVFSPQIETSSTVSIASLYPGSAYVNWNGIDGYNWGDTQYWSSWESFTTLFSKSYKVFMSIAPHTPLMIAETSTTNIGGDQGNWYESMLTDEIPTEFPHINAIVFFNENKLSTDGVNWRIDKTHTELEQFKTAISNPLYTSHI